MENEKNEYYQLGYQLSNVQGANKLNYLLTQQFKQYDIIIDIILKMAITKGISMPVGFVTDIKKNGKEYYFLTLGLTNGIIENRNKK